MAPNTTTLEPVIPDAIKNRYKEPGRHYHNLDHITHMLNLIPTDHPHARELTYATWFHDSVYDPQAKHGVNEKESIKLWEAHVSQQGEELKDIKDTVSLMIHSTISHTLPLSLANPQTALLQRFLDMDMDILASPRDTYLAYANKVRKEYSRFTDEQFRKGRIAFLRGEVGKERVFYLEENEGKNGVAFENMRAEIEVLGREDRGREA